MNIVIVIAAERHGKNAGVTGLQCRPKAAEFHGKAAILALLKH
jgi:hypothetical protein